MTVLFNMARGFENVCEVKASDSLKNLAGAIYEEEKWRNRDRKSPLPLENA